MKLSTNFTLFATILSFASPSCTIAAGNNKQGKQLRGGRNAMVVSEQELGKPQEKFTTNENELDEVVIEDFDDIQDDDDEDDTDEMQAFIDFVDAKEVSDSPAQKKAILVEEDDADDEDSEGADDDEDDVAELQAFIDFVDAKEKADSKTR